MNSFSELGLAAPIEKALASEGHATPTPIQSQAIPIVLQGRDLIGIAQTGTGKTAAFALPILHRLAMSPEARAKPRGCRVLVLSPTRELSSQIRERFVAYGRHLNLRTAIAIGGVSISAQIRSLADGVDVLIATPGRLEDLMRSGAVRLAETEVLVLDEADRMLDMGFVQAIRRIADKLPATRQSLFFSATMPGPIAALTKALLNNPVTVAVTPAAKTSDRVEQHVIFVPAGQKLPVLTEMLGKPAVERTLVFTRTKRGADRVVRGLEKDGVPAQAIHGNKTQAQREKALAGFRSGRVRVLVATDIAARGIDVPAVTHVFNFDLPNEPESYVHRIGRTARAGAGGIAISLCADDERPYLRAIEKLTRQTISPMETSVPRRASHTPEDAHAGAPATDAMTPRRAKISSPRAKDGRPRSNNQQPRAKTSSAPGRSRRRRPAAANAEGGNALPKWLLA